MPTVAIHIGNGDAIAVIVVDRQPVFARLLSNMIAEADTALFNLVEKRKLMKYVELFRRC